MLVQWIILIGGRTNKIDEQISMSVQKLEEHILKLMSMMVCLGYQNMIMIRRVMEFVEKRHWWFLRIITLIRTLHQMFNFNF